MLGREGEYKRTTGRFYVAVEEAVLLFGLDVWVLTPQLEKSLEGFHHPAARRVVVMGSKCQWIGRGCTHLLGRRCK